VHLPLIHEIRDFWNLRLLLRRLPGQVTEILTFRENLWIETSFTICFGRTNSALYRESCCDGTDENRMRVWVKHAINGWLTPAALVEGKLFLSVSKRGKAARGTQKVMCKSDH
jgi:hypothetical protein